MTSRRNGSLNCSDPETDLVRHGGDKMVMKGFNRENVHSKWSTIRPRAREVNGGQATFVQIETKEMQSLFYRI